MKRPRRNREFWLAIGLAAVLLAVVFFNGCYRIRDPASYGPDIITTATAQDVNNAATGIQGLREALYYEAGPDNQVQCLLCFRQCVIRDGQRGYCRNRENQGGVLYTLVYGQAAAVQIDPVEKEPMYHFYPGTSILCIGTAGCNFSCSFCHNWHLSQRSIEEVGRDRQLTPAEIVDLAVARGIPSISFTYNEPTVFFEYVLEIAQEAKGRGLNVIFHTNGAMSPAPLEDLLQYVDAVTVDLKGFSDSFYQVVSDARLDPVLESLVTIRQSGRWLEVVNLIIPTLNDDPEMIREMCRWIYTHLGAETPLHFNRFVPAYRLTSLPQTPVATLEQARDIAREEGLLFVTIGNVPGHENNSTFCHHCDALLIDRYHFTIRDINIEQGRCMSCQTTVPGRWDYTDTEKPD